MKKNLFHKLPDDLNWVRASKRLLDALNIGFLLQDMNDNILEVNESLLKINGKTRNELVGHNAREFYSESEYRPLRAEDLKKMGSGHYQAEYFLNHKDGYRIPVLFSVSINKDHRGRPISENVLVVDIREQKKIQSELKLVNKKLTRSNQELKNNEESLKKEKLKIEAILFGIGDSVSVFDPNGDHLLSNLQAKNIYKEKVPFLPLKSCHDETLTLPVQDRKRYFDARMEEIKDPQGNTFAYVEILKDISNEIELKAREHELLSIKRQIHIKKIASEIITSSAAMHNCINTALLCSERDSTVLITGETGVGKNMIAETIHNNSSRKDKPMVPVNCGALPENLIESELFGHVRGSFSGAISDSIGLFRAADGGTLFLDEVGDLGLLLQVKLLRAIQEKEIRPLGSNRNYRVNVRLLCATNKDLKRLVDEGLFRQDLYYRIAVIPLTIPPLRDRKEDIILLADHFIDQHTKKNRHQKLKLHIDSQKLFLEYKWPGNVRELENVIEYAVAMAEGNHILPKHLPVYLSLAETPHKKINNYGIASEADPPESLEETEREAILNALWRCRFNQSRAAKELGISRVTLWRKMEKYGMKDKMRS